MAVFSNWARGQNTCISSRVKPKKYEEKKMKESIIRTMYFDTFLYFPTFTSVPYGFALTYTKNCFVYKVIYRIKMVSNFDTIPVISGKG